MRDLTRQELKFVYGRDNYRCMFCGQVGLLPGPRGGLNMNMTCSHCGAVFNLLAPDYRKRLGIAPLLGVSPHFFGQLLQERIRPGTAIVHQKENHGT